MSAPLIPSASPSASPAPWAARVGGLVTNLVQASVVCLAYAGSVLLFLMVTFAILAFGVLLVVGSFGGQLLRAQLTAFNAWRQGGAAAGGTRRRPWDP